MRMTASLLEPALAWSGYLRRRLDTRPALHSWLLTQATTAVDDVFIDQQIQALQAEIGPVLDPVQAERRLLRQLRERLFCLLMVRDLAGLASLEEVVQAMTRLAEVTVARSYRVVAADLASVHGMPRDPATGLPQEMLIVGMGKLGGRELNVSSDIDLVMLYGAEGETDGPRVLSNHEFYARLTQRMMPVISEPDEWGQVFRTDLRLRPDGDAGPLAWSLAAFENYLFGQGREWERYAWLKGRLLPAKAFDDSNAQAQECELESLRRPFVYRKYLDFDALAALRNLRERIHQDWTRRATSPTGRQLADNIKLGRGGIREIEFVVQLFQLVRGGRNPALQQRSLLGALDAEQQLGLIDSTAATALAEAYRYLRKLEHTLQYREDQQTHVLPEDPDRREALAAAMGHASLADFETCLLAHRDEVAEQFKQVFRDVERGSQSSVTLELDPEQRLEQRLTELSSERREELAARLRQLLAGHRYRGLPETSRRRVDQLLPQLIEVASRTSDAGTALLGLLDLVESVAQRSAYLALLAEYPDTLMRVARLMAASPEAVRALIRYPILLDELIDERTLLVEPDAAAIARQLRLDLDHCLLDGSGEPDIERQMNLMRDLRHQVAFHLLALDLEGRLTVERLGDHLSALADLMLEETLHRVWPLIPHKGIEVPRFAVVAYGKHGGKELGYAGDLDLVFLYEDDHPDAQEVYTRLGQRLSTWMQAMTSSGRLYEVDLRLRPDGDAGLVVVSTEGFRRYQLDKAWPWEHQALTRARWCAGHKAVGERFEAIRAEVLLMPRDAHALATEIRAMRQRILDGHPNDTELFDLKHDPGGMVDVEFVTQFLVLSQSANHPVLLRNLGNIALLLAAAEAGLLDPALAQAAAEAYRLLRREQHACRLRGAEKARVPADRLAEQRQVVLTLWQTVLGAR
jgi:glutamate-ammonia-ligase adenylyltransferase